MVYRPCNKKIKGFWGDVNMIVKKEEIKNKLLKLFENEERIKCSICGETIGKYDIENMKFEYCGTETSENYAHSKCIEKMVKK